MTHHIVNVTLPDDGRVRTLQNPLEVLPGDTVEWRFVDAGERAIPDALIEFRGFIPESRTAPLMGPPRHPFTTLLSTQMKAGTIFSVASTDRGLYLYAIVRNDRPLPWEVPLFTVGSFSPLFGGIIIRDPQGGGG